MANQTIVSVPTQFKEFKQVRMFAVKLVEQLDIILGYRGTSGYQVAGANDAQDALTLASLNTTLQNLVLVTQSLQRSIASVNTVALSYRTNTTIADSAYTAPTVSPAYVQAEVQAIADGLETVSQQLDATLAVLRDVQIID